MALKDWKKTEGMESPGWYNVRFTNKNKEIILSNEDGSKNKNIDWTVGVYENDDPIFQRTFSNKENAIKYAKVLMKRGYNK